MRRTIPPPPCLALQLPAAVVAVLLTPIQERSDRPFGRPLRHSEGVWWNCTVHLCTSEYKRGGKWAQEKGVFCKITVTLLKCEGNITNIAICDVLWCHFLWKSTSHMTFYALCNITTLYEMKKSRDNFTGRKAALMYTKYNLRQNKNTPLTWNLTECIMNVNKDCRFSQGGSILSYVTIASRRLNSQFRRLCYFLGITHKVITPMITRQNWNKSLYVTAEVCFANRRNGAAFGFRSITSLPGSDQTAKRQSSIAW